MGEPAVYEWGADPIFHTHARLLICHVLQLKPSAHVPRTFFLGGTHPIRKAVCCGVLTSVAVREKQTVYEVDDGTGTLTCTYWHNNTPEADANNSLDLADSVMLWGIINDYRGVRQMTVNLLCKVSPTQECVHWMEAMHVYKTCNQPSRK
eukprot:m.353037 g.353037  ORF g.353037 m.353037 type:complete len:150 (+) comp16670_c0_seq1:101-550(+)